MNKIAKRIIDSCQDKADIMRKVRRYGDYTVTTKDGTVGNFHYHDVNYTFSDGSKVIESFFCGDKSIEYTIFYRSSEKRFQHKPVFSKQIARF